MADGLSWLADRLACAAVQAACLAEAQPARAVIARHTSIAHTHEPPRLFPPSSSSVAVAAALGGWLCLGEISYLCSELLLRQARLGGSSLADSFAQEARSRF